MRPRNYQVSEHESIDPFEEVMVIRKMVPVKVVVHHPKTPEGNEELARRVSEVHASAVVHKISSLSCPTGQKLELLDAVIESVRNRNREQS